MGCSDKRVPKDIAHCELVLPEITRQELKEGMNGNNAWVNEISQDSNSTVIYINLRAYKLID